MTLEELRQAAEGGNVEAMNKLADELYAQGQAGTLPTGASDALEWYTRAAEKGSVYGILKTMIMRQNISVQAKHRNYWKFVKENAELSMKYALIVRSANGLPAKYQEMASEALDSARYHMALVCFYQDDDIPTCISWLRQLEGQELLMANILLGICLLKTHCADEAYNYLSPLRGKRDQILPRPAAPAEESLVGIAFFYLSVIYRTVKNDLETAHSVLEEGLQSVEDQDAQELLREDLARYRKGIFGGYRYQ